ncbi:hypothetical protein D3C85_1873150 [compost metagenome]
MVSLGRPNTITKASASRGYTSQGTPSSSGTCAMKTRMARALTKPTITDRGIKRISLVTPDKPRMIWKAPARMTAAIR